MRMVAHNVNVLDATDLHVQNDLNGKSHVCFATIFKKIKERDRLCKRQAANTREKLFTVEDRADIIASLSALNFRSVLIWFQGKGC